jgi:hypothetical protein
VPYESYVRIGLYDASGREVRALHDGFSGDKTWVVARADVASLASGLYFYRVQVEGFAGKVFDETKGLVVLH